MMICVVESAGVAAHATDELMRKQAVFKVKNVFTVPVRKGAKMVRMWLAVPQEDAQSSLRKLTVATDQTIHFNTDSWGNRVAYLERRDPTENQIVVREEFELIRSESRNRLDPANSRPLTPGERTALSHYLQPATHVT